MSLFTISIHQLPEFYVVQYSYNYVLAEKLVFVNERISENDLILFHDPITCEESIFVRENEIVNFFKLPYSNPITARIVL